MGADIKQYFVERLKDHYRDLISGAHRAESSAGQAVESIRSDARSREDAKNAVTEARLATAFGQRRLEAKREIDALISFTSRGLPRFGRDSTVGLGALIDVEIETDEGAEERTLFLLPVGAGCELTGPGGDGFVSVITPTSPVGRALSGAQVGDSVEVVSAGRRCDWTVLDLV